MVQLVRSLPHLYVARASALTVPALGATLLLLHDPPRCAMAQHLHVPCPGCGLTRASRLLLNGQLAASFHLHPLLVPMVMALVALGSGIALATLLRGWPGALVESRVGRVVLAFAAIVAAASVLLWGLRFTGLFGGPVPV